MGRAYHERSSRSAGRKLCPATAAAHRHQQSRGVLITLRLLGEQCAPVLSLCVQQFQDPGDQLVEDVHGLIASLQQKGLVHELPK